MKATLRTFKTVCVAAFILIAGISHAATYTAVASGNWSSGATWGGVAPGNNILLDNIIIPAGISVALDQDVTFNGLLSSLEVQGSLQSSNGGRLMMNQGALTGGGVIDVVYLSFGSALTTMTFSGTLTVNRLVNSAAALAFSAIVNVADSLTLENGTITLNSGANLTMGSSSTILVNNGTLSMNGGAFSGGSYAVKYIGTAKTTGLEAMGTGLTRFIMTMDANEDLTLSSNVIINDFLNLNSGTLIMNGYDIVLNGDYITTGPATIAGSATSSMTIKNSSGISNGLRFEGGAELLEDFTVDLNDDTSLHLLSNLTVMDSLKLTRGTVKLMNTSTLAMGANSDIIVLRGHLDATNGTFDGSAVHNATLGGPTKRVGPELTGSGLNDLYLALNSATDSAVLTGNVNMDGDLILGLGILSLNGSHLTMTGNVEGNGMIHANSASNLNVTADNDDTINFTGAAQLNALNVSAANGGYIYIGQDLTVNTLGIGSGSLKITNNHVTVNNGINGTGNNSYVMIDGSGTLRMNLTTSTTTYTEFPVGTTKSYSPARLQVNTGGATGMYHVGIRKGFLLNGTSGTDISGTERVLDRTWDISTTATGSVNMNIKLAWTDSAEKNGFNRSVVSVVHYTGGDWNAGTFTAASTTGGVHEATRMNVTSLSPFSVADSSAELDSTGPGGPTGIYENEIAFSSVYPNPVKDELNCVINVSNTAVINVTDVTGRVIYTENILAPETNGKHTIDFSTVPSGIYFISIQTGESKIIKKVIKS